MPSPGDILAGLTEIANQAVGIAIAWHLALALVLVALARGWRPSQRTARALIALPLASVSALAFTFGNPFNGVVFGAGALTLAALAGLGDRRPASPGPSAARWVGFAMIAYGWVYPHFLEAQPLASLYAAPVGLVPCPSLAVAIGFALLGGGLGARAWSVSLAALGLFYGVFGALRLGVVLDFGLIVGAVALVATVFRARTEWATLEVDDGA